MTKKELETLIDRYLSDTATTEERRIVDQFYTQLSEKKENSQMWDPLDKALLKERIYSTIQSQLRSDSGRRLRYMITSAAAVIILLISGFLFFLSTEEKPSVIKYPITELSESAGQDQHSILLGDGTYVLLSPGATLIYPEIFEEGLRKVKLTGEAWFDVQHDENRPFQVFSNDVVTTVLGTSFSINADADGKDIKVNVTSGRVKVDSEKEELAVLEKDDQLIFKGGQVKISRKVPERTRKEELPEPGAFKLANVSLEEAGSFLEKRWKREIEFENPDLKMCPLYASFNTNDPIDEVLMVLCGVTNSKYKKENGKIIIYGKGCLQE